MSEAQSIFYDYDKLQSYNCFLNFVLASRGVGKTYGAITAVIKDFLKNGNQFIYMRRYKTELQTCVPNFFAQHIYNEAFPDHDLEVRNNKFYIDGELAGYAIALSTSKILKSTGFPQVRTIVFDEFTITTGVYHYLSSEINDFLDFVETVFRMRDNGRVWLLGNSTTLYNPYFNYWNISTPYEGEFKLYQDGLILVNYVTNHAYADAKMKTRFGRLVSGTKYGDYAIMNKFLQDSESFIRKRPHYAKFFFNLHLEGNTFGIWFDNDAYWYVSDDYDPDSKANFSISRNDHTETTLLLSRVDPIIKNLLERFKDAHLVFESAQIKGAMVANLLKYAN